MDYSFAPLYMRIIYLMLIGVAVAVIIWKFPIKRSENVRKLLLLFWVIAACIAIVSTMDSVINPQIETVTGVFVQEQWYRVRTYPFRRRFELLCDGKTVYLELDALTKQAVLSDVDELEKGKSYVFAYEERENLILSIREE